MKTSFWMLALGSLALVTSGCGQSDVTESDVESARDEYREELQDAHETLTESQKEVAEEMKEAQKAEAELQHVEKQHRQTQQRDLWIQEQRNEIKALRDRVAQLSASAQPPAEQPAAQGEPRPQAEEHLNSIEEELNEAEAGLDTVQSADLDAWETEKPEVTAHIQQAKQELQLLQTAN